MSCATTIQEGVDAHGRITHDVAFTVDTQPATLWQTLKSTPTPSLFRRVAGVEKAETIERTDVSTVLVAVTFLMSKRLRIRDDSELEVTYDDEARGIHVRTLKSRWGTLDASLTLRRSDGEGATCAYRASFGVNVGGVATSQLPFVAAKLCTFSHSVVSAIQESVMKRCWRRELADSFERIVLSVARDEASRFEDMLRRTACGGKMYRALLVRLAFRNVAADPVESSLTAVHAVGWALELMQASALVANDIMDASVTRRGRPCWHVTVGAPLAINDALCLLSEVHRVLARHLPPALLGPIATIAFDVVSETCVGQFLDMTTSQCTSEVCERITELKTTRYTFELPIVAGIMLAQLRDGDDEARLIALAKRSAVEIGKLFQTRDDYEDVFGDQTKKVGTDIATGKRTWLLCHALSNATVAQTERLTELYGTNDDITEVRSIFEQTGVHRRYESEMQRHASECLKVASGDHRICSIVTAIVGELTHTTKAL